MTITGIIVEYNPMHNGHLFHISKTREIAHSETIIAVMSGNFVQRGEPAFINKWARTKMALEGGVDLVLELPLLYSISSAEGFAFGSVATLDALGIVDNLCFGSECGDLKLLHTLANILTQEPASYKKFLQDELKSGISYPKARQKSLTNYIITNNLKNVNSNIAEKTLQSSNNILGIEYIKALIKISSNIEPITIHRIANNYNDSSLTGNISSATSIRNNFNDIKVMESIPSFTREILEQEINEGRGPLTLDHFSDLLLYKIRTMSADELSNILDMEIGLNYNMKRAAENCGSVSSLLEAVKNKRYTSTRLKRILLYILFGITKDLNEKIKTPPEYVRVLGFTEKGRKVLNSIKKTCPVKIIVNPSSDDNQLLKYDLMATDTYVLGYQNSKYKYAKQDLKTRPIIK